MFDSLFPKHWTTLQRLMWLKTNALARAVYETITGNPVSFSAKAAPLRRLSVAFSPVQSLNGYDSPWPAGGGKNKFNIDAVPTRVNSTGSVTNNGDGTLTIHYITGSSGQSSGKKLSELANLTVGQTYTLSATTTGNDFIYLNVYGASWKFGTAKTVTQEILDSVVYFYATYTEGSTATISDFQIELGSSATSYAPYSNECPISGWSSLTVEQRGKNLLNLARTSVITSPHSSRDFAENQVWVGLSFNNYFNSSRISDYEITGGGITVECNSVAYGVAFPISCKPNTAYIVSWGSESANATVAIGYYKKDGTYISYAGASTNVRTVTTPNECEWFTVCFAPNATDVAASYSNVQLELGSTATEYVPYNPSSRSISISLGETVYSGYVDVISGVGEVTHGIVDLGTLRWTDNGVGTFYTPSLNRMKKVGGDDCVCSALVKAAQNTSLVDMPNASFRTYANSANIVLKLSGMTAENAQEMLSGFQLVYPLATPITIQLTPQEVQSLLGENNMWSNANQPITVEYRKN